jgi:tetratricopeptide (TPR) repeat protein
MSENIEKAVKRVEKYNAQGKYEASIELLKPLLQEQPENIQLINIMGVSCDLAGKKFMAVNYFHKSADYYFQRKFYDKALAVYKKILKVNPDDARSYECSAKIIEVNGNFNEAANNFKSAALKYHHDGNNEKAIALYLEAVKLAPFDQRLKLELIDLYKKLGNTGKAIDLYLDFADNFIAKGDFAGARTILENILKLDSENITALKQLANVAEKLGDKEQTLAARQKILSYDPENTEALFSFALQYYERFSDVDNTVNMLKKAHRLQPDNIDILLKLRELCPNDLEVRQALKVYYLDHDDKKRAVEEILGIADLFDLSKNKSMAEKLRSKANDMLREIDLGTYPPTSSANTKEKVVSLDSLTSSRFVDKENQENAETNPYFAGLLVQEDRVEPAPEIKPILENKQEQLNIAPAPSIQKIEIKKSKVPIQAPPIQEKIAAKMDNPPAQLIPEVGQKPSATPSIIETPPKTILAENKSNIYQTTSEHQIIFNIQDSTQISKTESSIYPEQKNGTAKVVPLDTIVSEAKPQKKTEIIKDKSTASIKTEKEMAESIIIDDVDIDPNTLTIKVSTSDIKPEEIKKRMAETPDPSQKTGIKIDKNAEPEKPQSILSFSEEHKDVSVLIDKLPDENLPTEEKKQEKFRVLEPEITKEILGPTKAVEQKVNDNVIQPPKFLQDRLDIKIVQLSKDDPLKATREKLTIKDDSPEIYLQVVDLEELEKTSSMKTTETRNAVIQKAEVTKDELRILEQTTPIVQEEQGFDIQKVIKNIKISDDAAKPVEKGKKLFSDNTANLSIQMNNIFSSMISDAVTDSVEDDESRFNLGISYMEMGLYDDAIAEFRSVVDKKNYSVRSVRCLALAYSHKQDNHEALKWYVKAAELLPPGSEERLEALYSAGDLCLTLNDYANAQKYLMEIYHQNPTYHGVIEKLEIINSKTRKLEQA